MSKMDDELVPHTFQDVAGSRIQKLTPTRSRLLQYQLFQKECAYLFDQEYQNDNYDIHSSITMFAPQWNDVAGLNNEKSFVEDPIVIVSCSLSNGPESTFGSIFLGKVQGVPLVVKVFKNPEILDCICHSIHELLMGVTVINPIRQFCPVFIETLGFSLTPYIFTTPQSSPELQKLIEKTTGNVQESSGQGTNERPDPVPVILLEPVFPSLSLEAYFSQDQIDSQEIMNLYLHIFYALHVAHYMTGFIHEDLTLSNILLQLLPDVSPSVASHFGTTSQEELFLTYPISEQRTRKVLLKRYIPRIIDYGLSSTPDFQYVPIIHPTSETGHFLNDISKLLGFSIWNQHRQDFAISSHGSDDRSYVPRTLAQRLGSFLHEQNRELLSNDIQLHRYIDYMILQLLYTMLYAPKLRPVRERQIFDNNMFQGHSFLLDMMFVLGMFEQVLTDVSELADQRKLDDTLVPYLPRHFNPLLLVNHFYLPNFTIFLDIEEAYIKGSLDRAGQRQVRSLHRLIEYLRTNRFFSRFLEFWNIQSTVEIPQLVARQIVSYHELLPDINTFIDNVVLKGSDSFSQEFQDSILE